MTGAAMTAGGIAGAATGAVVGRATAGTGNILMSPYNLYEGYKQSQDPPHQRVRREQRLFTR